MLPRTAADDLPPYREQPWDIDRGRVSQDRSVHDFCSRKQAVAPAARKLHSAWDTCLVLAAVPEDVDDAARDLMKSITPAKIEKWTHSDAKDWANETFAIAVRPQTKYCVEQGGSCNLEPGSVKVDAAYIAANGPVVREQLQKAGVRLAHLLDAALGK